MNSQNQNRANAAGYLAAGGALYGTGAVASYGLDRGLERKNIKKPLRSLVQDKKLVPAHAPYLAAKTGIRALQVTGLPLAAAGAYGVLKPKKTRRVDVREDVLRPMANAAMYKDAAEKFGKSVTPMTAQEHALQAKRKQRARNLSLVSGTLGVTALGLRAPEAAAQLARRAPKVAKPLSRIAAKEPGATKLSNTLGVGAIGVGSAGSFNYARLVGQEAKAEQKYVGKAMSREDKRKVAAGVAAGTAGTLMFPTLQRMPDDGGASDRIARQLNNRDTGTVKVKDVRGVARGAGERVGNSAYIARMARDVQSGKFDLSKQPLEVTRYKDGKMMVTGGHHRLEALERLGREDAPVKLHHAPSKTPRSVVPLFQAPRYVRDVVANRQPRPKQSLSQIKAEASKPIPKWGMRVNRAKSTIEEGIQRAKSPRAVAGLAALGGAAAGASVYRNQRNVSKAEQYDRKKHKVLPPGYHLLVEGRGKPKMVLSDEEMREFKLKRVVDSYERGKRRALTLPELQMLQRESKEGIWKPYHPSNPKFGEQLKRGKFVTDEQRMRRNQRLRALEAAGRREKGAEPWGSRRKSKVAKRDDRFLREYRDRISPQAEEGYKYLKRGRDKAAGISSATAGLGASTALATAMDLGRKRYGRAALDAGLTAVNAHTSISQGKKAVRWNSHMDKIKNKAYEREKAGIYGRQRNVDVAKAFLRVKAPEWGRAFPKGTVRRPSMRKGSVRSIAGGKVASFRGSYG